MASRSDRYRDQSVESREAQDDASSEINSPLMGREEHSEKRLRTDDERAGQARQMSSMLSSWRWLLDTGLLLVIVGLLLDRRWQGQNRVQFEGNGDLTGFAPTGEAPRDTGAQDTSEETSLTRE